MVVGENLMHFWAKYDHSTEQTHCFWVQTV